MEIYATREEFAKAREIRNALSSGIIETRDSTRRGATRRDEYFLIHWHRRRFIFIGRPRSAWHHASVPGSGCFPNTNEILAHRRDAEARPSCRINHLHPRALTAIRVLGDDGKGLNAFPFFLFFYLFSFPFLSFYLIYFLIIIPTSTILFFLSPFIHVAPVNLFSSFFGHRSIIFRRLSRLFLYRKKKKKKKVNRRIHDRCAKVDSAIRPTFMTKLFATSKIETS